MTITDANPACFYHPIKVIFLDDSRAFLDALDLEFGEKYNILTLESAEQAYNLLDGNRDIIQSIFKLMKGINLDTANDRMINFNISKILNQIYDKTRFEYIPLLVVDYQMPAVNGIEFCIKIKDKKVFKIMLTAEADKNIAIQAFNNQLINKFILKTSENLYSEITLAINDLTQRYFNELTKHILHACDTAINDLFDNQRYQQLFVHTLKQAQAVEYYLVDTSGSILFLDKNAKPTWLIIRHIKELSDQFDLMQGYELPEQVITAVARREKILFFLSEKEYKKPIAEWEKYLLDAQKLDNNYYYSISKDRLTDSIDWEKVVSYSSYLAES